MDWNSSLKEKWRESSIRAALGVAWFGAVTEGKGEELEKDDGSFFMDFQEFKK